MTYTGSSKLIALNPFNQLADYYATEMDNNSFAKYLERPAMIDLAGSVIGKKVLDIGCGSGWHSNHFLNQGADVVSIDISPEMVKRARMRVGDRGDIRVADIEESLPFIEDGEIQLVFASLVLHFMQEWHLALSEIHRVLAPGGEFVFSVCHPTFTDYPRSNNRRYNQTEIVSEKVGGVTTRRYRKTFSAIMNAIAQAGFTLVEMREPEPTMEMLSNQNPSEKMIYDYLVENPYFLCMKVKKL